MPELDLAIQSMLLEGRRDSRKREPANKRIQVTLPVCVTVLIGVHWEGK
jgi:hypothetical protein